MRKILRFLVLAVLGLAGRPVVAAPVVVESSFELSVATGPTTVSCSSFTWTALGTSSSGTFGIFVKDLDTNSGNTRVMGTSTSSAPGVSTTTYQWSLTPAANAMYLGGGGKRIYFWCVTSNTSGSETAVFSEVRPIR